MRLQRLPQSPHRAVEVGQQFARVERVQAGLDPSSRRIGLGMPAAHENPGEQRGDPQVVLQAVFVAGPIRLAITEGLGSFWLTPRIVDYMNDTGAQNRIELQCAMRSVDVLRMEIAPRAVAGLFATLLLSAMSGTIALVLAYLLAHGLVT